MDVERAVDRLRPAVNALPVPTLPLALEVMREAWRQRVIPEPLRCRVVADIIMRMSLDAYNLQTPARDAMKVLWSRFASRMTSDEVFDCPEGSLVCAVGSGLHAVAALSFAVHVMQVARECGYVDE